MLQRLEGAIREVQFWATVVCVKHARSSPIDAVKAFTHQIDHRFPLHELDLSEKAEP